MAGGFTFNKAQQDMSEKQQGVVRFYNVHKGYGFIAPDGSDKDIFVHATALSASRLEQLREGDKVEFETEPGKKSGKPQAVNLRMVA